MVAVGTHLAGVMTWISGRGIVVVVFVGAVEFVIGVVSSGSQVVAIYALCYSVLFPIKFPS